MVEVVPPWRDSAIAIHPQTCITENAAIAGIIHAPQSMDCARFSSPSIDPGFVDRVQALLALPGESLNIFFTSGQQGLVFDPFAIFYTYLTHG
jgi:hypothetical protein